MRCSQRYPVALAALACVLLACGPTSPAPAAPCERLKCPARSTCDPMTATCVPDDADGGDGGEEADAGTDADGGLEADGGTEPDGGVEPDGGSEPDGGAGTDAGMEPDGGTEPDAGTGADAGMMFPPCDQNCLPPKVCDPTGNGGAGACVTCTATLGCTSPTGVCDTSVPGGQCVGCLGDGDCFGQTPVCDSSTHACVGCLDDGDCFAPFPACDLQSQTCVGCLSNADCQAPTPACDTQSDTCVECLSNQDCGGTTPICDPVGQTCGPCTSDAECGTGFSCGTGGACEPLPEACASAQTLTFTQGTFQVDTTQAADDEAGTCGPSGGAELVFHFNLTATRDLDVQATPGFGSSADPVVYLRAAPCAGGAELACSDSASSGATESLSLPNLPAGDYYLVVETAGTTVGTVDVTVTLTAPPMPPPNDTCAQAEVLTFTAQAASATGTTVDGTNDNATGDTTPSCSASARQDGADVVYQFTLAQTQDVQVTALPTVPGFQPVVYVRGPQGNNACGSDTQLGCGAATAAGQPASLALQNLAAGTYFVWVDSAQQTRGPFQLQVSLSTATPNDDCASPEDLVFSSGVATTSGDTSLAQDDNGATDASPTCSTSAKNGGPDLVYRYTLSQTRDVSLVVTPSGASPTFQPVVYVRAAGTCADPAASSELACAADFTSGPQAIDLFNQPPGTYFVWVDSAQGTAGPFDLQVALSTPPPPPANDACPGEALTFSGGVATATGGTPSATNDNSGGDAVPTCSTTAKSAGKDVLYSYTLTQPRDVTVTVTPTSAGFTPVFYVKRSACASFAIGDELVCREAAASGPVTATLLNQPAGTYWIWLDGADGTEGTYQLDVTLAAPTPPPPNDTCSGAEALSFVGDVATASGDNTTASNGNGASDNSPTCSATAKQKGKDLVYSFTLAQAKDVTVTVQPTGSTSGFVPAAYLRGPGALTCDSLSAGNEQLCEEGATAGQAVTGTAWNLPPGDYFVWVDASDETAGPFDLTVTLGGPTPPPSNETCASPEALTLGMAASGDTTLAEDDYARVSFPAYSGACQAQANFPYTGNDLVYAFTATGTQHTATLTPDPGWDPALLLLQPLCGADACTDVSDVVGDGAVETLIIPTTAGNTYYLVVDHWDRDFSPSVGAFTLTVN